MDSAKTAATAMFGLKTLFLIRIWSTRIPLKQSAWHCQAGSHMHILFNIGY